MKAAEEFSATFDLKSVMLFRRLVSSLPRISVKHHFSVSNGTGCVFAQTWPRERQLAKTQRLLNLYSKKVRNGQSRHWLLVLWPEILIKSDPDIIVLVNVNVCEQSTQTLTYICSVLYKCTSDQ